MRIAHVTDCYLPRLGGIEIQVHDLALAQAARGHDVEIVTSTPGGGLNDPLVVHRLGTDRGTAKVVGAGVRRVLSGCYDVVHVHLSIMSPLGMSVLWAAASEDQRVVATMHSMCGPTEVALPHVRRVLGRRVGKVAWTAVSSAAADPLRRGLGAPVSVVPNGVDVPWWSDATHSAPADELRVASVMRLTRRKRPLSFLRMIEAADERMRTSPCGRHPASSLAATIVGDGRLFPRTRRAADHARVGVTLTGRLGSAEIRDVLSGHDVYVAPAPLESFGLAALEARSAGLPVIAYRGSGVADFIRHGWDGVLVDNDDEIVSALAQLAGRRDLLRHLQGNARQCAPPLGWPHTLVGYERVYEARRLATSPSVTAEAIG